MRKDIYTWGYGNEERSMAWVHFGMRINPYTQENGQVSDSKVQYNINYSISF